ncbi:MAG TPA: septum formation initiator family protein [Candidatus Binataceae bacterium]
MYRLSQWLHRESLTLILGALLVAVCLNFALTSHGLRDLLILRHHRNRLETEREHKQAEERDLEATVEKLQSDDAYLQRLIRKELGFALPNELIYRFAGDNAPASSPNAP